MDNYILVIHGGAGTIMKENMSSQMEKDYRNVLNLALQKGFAILKNGGTSLDAVEAAIKIMEDSPLFNAGKGSVFTNDGKNEMDASIMDGKTLNAGAVAGVRIIKNPIAAARAVMEKSPHVLMVGRGAENFAQQYGIEIVDTSYFFDDERWKQQQKIKDTEKQQLDHSPEKDKGSILQLLENNKFGTVGAVALDKNGNLAAATSTGGMTNKKFGRVGDSPIIGAGTYANNNTCAVSCTGHGEFFIRKVIAYDISAMMEYKGFTVQQAADEAVFKKLLPIGGMGGVIAVDKKGNFTMPFNTPGMYRGYIKANGESEVLMYK